MSTSRRLGTIPTRPSPWQRAAAWAACLGVLYACAAPGAGTGSTLSSRDSADVIQAVEAATWAFHAADTSRNAEGVVALLWPEYSMFVDGNYLTYGQAVEGSRGFLPTLSLFHTEWTDLHVLALGPNAAVSAFRFRDSLVTRSGDLIRSTGTTTFVWQRRGSEWRVLYGDADHRPVTP